MKKSLLILMMALFSAGVLSAQEGDAKRVHGFSGGAANANGTTIILGQAFAFQETDGGFELAAGVAEAQLERGHEEVVTLTPDQDYTIEGWGTLTAPVEPGNYNIYKLYTDNYNYDSVWVYKVKRLDCEGTVEDYDGNPYEMVGVAGYCWTKSNLKAQHYFDDGSEIQVALIYNAAPDNDEDANLADFGRLYTWYSAVNLPEGSTDSPAEVDGYVQGICPTGWHIPTVEEMNALKQIPLRKLNEEGDQYWLTPNDNNNETQFSARGAGRANVGNSTYPAFALLRGWTDFWTSEKNASGQANAFEIRHFCEYHVQDDVVLDPKMAVSVRCVRTENADGE